MRRLSVIFLFALAALAPAAAQAGVILWDQLPGSVNGAWSSQNDTNPGGLGNFATVYDNFTLVDSANIARVEWEGQFFITGNPNPPTNGITGFTLTFWADNGGQPGASLQSAFIAGNAGQTSIGPGAFGPAFSYGASLPASFAATGGTQYWLSIVPDLGFLPQWAWDKTSPPGSGVSYQDFLGTRFQRDDLAFRLVPEPSTMLLLGAGFAAVLRRRLTRRA